MIALEPNPPAYELAFQNLKAYAERAILIKKGLWASDQNLLFGGDTTGASIQDKGFAIECVSMPTILKEYSIDRIDILKMDVEGAEKTIFAAKPEEWLNRVGLLIIEIHGREIFNAVSTVLRRSNFNMRQYRSVWYCSRSH